MVVLTKAPVAQWLGTDDQRHEGTKRPKERETKGASIHSRRWGQTGGKDPAQTGNYTGGVSRRTDGAPRLPLLPFSFLVESC